jgi:hypothetical protein
VVLCVDEFGPLNLQPHPGRHWQSKVVEAPSPGGGAGRPTPAPHFTLDGTDHPCHHAQASMIRRYIAWRNRNAHDHRFREIVNRAKVA